MIHFDFTVTDVDAENIFSMMHERISANNMKILDHMAQSVTQDGHEVYIEAYRQDNEYVEGLIKKMKNTRVVQ